MYNLTGRLTVKARSSVHDTTTVWDKLTGEANADPDAIEAATARISVDMTSFDAGDWLKNRRIRKDLDFDRHPTATFTLDRTTNVRRSAARFEATAIGTLRWRGIELPLELAGQGTLDPQRLAATATFSLDITRFGIKPPKLFIFKVEDVVTIDVALTGVAS